MLGIDLQQVSIATLIIALGLLVDVPVVRAMASNAAWRKAATHDCVLARPHQTGDRDFLRDDHEYHCLSAIPDAHRQYRRVLEEPPRRDDGFSAVRALCFDDVRPVLGLLHFACSGKARTYHRGKTRARILRFLQQTRRQSHKTPLGCPWRIVCFPGHRWDCSALGLRPNSFLKMSSIGFIWTFGCRMTLL